MPERNQKKLKGSFTIEAAVVVPVTMVLLVGVIFLTIYVHDHVTIKAATDYILLENAKDSKTAAGRIKGELENLLNRKMLGSTGISVYANSGENRITAGASAEFNIPFGMLRKIFGDGALSISTESSLKNINGRKELLIYKSILEGAGKLLGGN